MAEARAVERVADTIAALRAEHPRTDGCGWDFDGFRVWIDSNAPGLLAQLQRYFADFRRLEASSLAEARSGGPLTHISAIECAPPDLAAGRALAFGEHKPSVRGPKEAYFDTPDGRVIHKVRTGMWFLFGHDLAANDWHLAIGPCSANPNQVINFVNNRMIQWALHRGALLGHASAVGHVRPGAPLPRAIAIAGFSGMGKSTLALHLMNDRRVDFLSNDRVMIHAPHGDAPAQLQGVPKHPRINPGTILHNRDLAGVLSEQERERFEQLEPAALWQLEHKYDGLIRECFPTQRFFLRAELVGLVLLDWRHGAGPATASRIDLTQRRELLPALIKEPGLFYRPGPGEVASRDPDRYLEYLAELPILELAGGVDFDYGRAAALELLGV